MRIPGTKVRALFVVSGIGGAVTACSQGPSESEYIETCLKQGLPHAQITCECIAREGKAGFTTDAWSEFVLRTQGRDAAANEIRRKMSPADSETASSVEGQILGKCMPKA
jgi:hypothetical protein